MTNVDERLPVRRGHMEAGELAEPIDAYAAYLSGLGYTALTIKGYTDSARHLGAWLALSGLTISAFDEHALERFARHECRCGGNRSSDRLSSKYMRRVHRFTHYLSDCGIIPKVAPAALVVDPSVARFGEWLRRHRGLSERTIARHVRMVTRLLPALGVDPDAYDASRVRAVILAEGARCSAAYVKTMAMALRGYLRFLATRGECRPGLDHAVPPTPDWRLSALPRYLLPKDVTRLIEGCDLSLSRGIRDRAILLLLSRLGLRAHDIWAMEIDDVDWAAGTVRVRGKRRREVRLPLPQEAGDALLATSRMPARWWMSGESFCARRHRMSPSQAPTWSRPSSAPPSGEPGSPTRHRREPTFCVTQRRRPCCGRARRSMQSARYCATSRLTPQPTMPRSISRRCA